MSNFPGFAEIGSGRRSVLFGTAGQSRSSESRSGDAVLVDRSPSVLLDSRQRQREVLLR